MDRSGFRINLLLVDDHQPMTDGLAKLLEAESTIGEIHIATNGQQAVDIVLMHDIDCVIMDINMPILNGLEATKHIKKESLGLR